RRGRAQRGQRARRVLRRQSAQGSPPVTAPRFGRRRIARPRRPAAQPSADARGPAGSAQDETSDREASDESSATSEEGDGAASVEGPPEAELQGVGARIAVEHEEEPADKTPPAPAAESNALVPADNLQRYLSEIRRYPLLTPEEEHTLAVRWK